MAIFTVSLHDRDCVVLRRVFVLVPELAPAFFMRDTLDIEHFTIEMLHISCRFALAKQDRKRASAVQPPEQFTHFIRKSL